jgi:uncharacterized membrane protein
MKKLLLISLVFLLALFSVNAAGVIDITTITPQPATVDPGASAALTLNVANTGDATINSVLITSTDLTLGTNKINAPSISSISTLTNTTPQSVAVTVSVGGVPAGIYTGTITATDASNSLVKDTITYTVTVNSKAVLTVSGLTNDKLIFNSQKDTSKNKIITVKNDGSKTLNPTASIEGNFTDNDNDQITFSLTAFPTGGILPGSQADVTVTASLPNDIDLKQYTGTLTVKDTGNLITKTIPLEVNVEPEICEDGRVSNSNSIDNQDQGNIKVDVKDPDDGDDFSPGSEIKISVNVENDMDDDIDVIVEAILYNIDQDSEIERVESDSISIDEDEDEDLDLILKVPTSDSDLDESDNYILFVKAYEDGNEDENCNYEEIELDFERNTNDVAINKLTISPSVVSCSETVNFAVEVQNVGTKEQDSVQVKLKETSLGLDLNSEVFGLKKYDKSGDTALKTFQFKIPENTKEGDYYVDVITYFASKSTSLSLNKLTVSGCKAVLPEVSVTLPQTSFTATQGKVFTVPVLLKNPGTQAVTYSVNAEADNNWADVSAEQKVSIAAGEQTTVYIYLTPKTSLAAGSYTATVNVKQDNALIKTEKVTANVAGSQAITGGTVYQPSVTFGSVWNKLAQSTAFWIAAIVVVFALIIYVLSALLRPK